MYISSCFWQWWKKWSTLTIQTCLETWECWKLGYYFISIWPTGNCLYFFIIARTAGIGWAVVRTLYQCLEKFLYIDWWSANSRFYERQGTNNCSTNSSCPGYNEEIQAVACRSDRNEVVAKLPTFSSLKTSLYRQRRSLLPPLPKTRADVHFDGKEVSALIIIIAIVFTSESCLGEGCAVT